MKKLLSFLLIILLTLIIGCSENTNTKDSLETKEEVYYCDKCLKKSNEKSKFCPNCGEQCNWLLTDNKKRESDEEKDKVVCDNCNNVTDRFEIALNGGVCNACKDKIVNCNICGTRILEKDNYNDGYCNICVQYKDACHDCRARTTERAIVSYFPEVGYSLCLYCQGNHICSNCYNLVDYIDPTMKTCYKCTEEISGYYSEMQSQASYSCNNCLGCTHTTSDIPEGTMCSYCGANSGYTKRDVCHCFDY